ncbi:MAG: IS1182 family transposase [Patescibacteria group bacterium]|nr:IS1182 family transposase [Patescibacteria group bacterium]
MLGEQDKTKQIEFFTPLILEQFIPDDYILKKVDRVLNLSWIRDEVRDLYSETMGRPSIDPECAVRLMLAGFFLGIVHDRKLMKEAELHLGIRWFAGYSMDDQVHNHSTLSKLRRRWGVELFKKIFQRTVQQCVDAGLVDVETVHVDATLIRANASWDSIVEVYTDEVVKENDKEEDEKPERKRGSGKKKVSVTDPDCSLAQSSKFDKPQPRYKQHTSVEDRSGVVVDVGVTTGRAQESHELVEQVRRVEENTGMKPGKVTCDAGYAAGANFEAMEEIGIDAMIPTRRESVKGKSIPVRRFKYDEKHDFVKCPGGKKMRRGARSVNGGWHYVARVADCKKCHLRPRCVSEKRKSRSVVIVDGYSALLRARRKNLREKLSGRDEYIRHKWLVEGRHGEAKEFHGLRRAVRRGLEQVEIQVFMTAAVMNLKRLAAALYAAFYALTPQIEPFWASLQPRQIRFLFRSVFLSKNDCNLPMCLINPT